MFVLVNAYDNTNPYLSIAERLGNAMSTAGMSITVTSFTDIFAFLIGSTTSLPALRNFCFYAALGIFFDYLYQLTFFRSVLSHRRTPPNAKERGLLLLPNLRRRRDVLRSVLQASGGGHRSSSSSTACNRNKLGQNA